MLDESYQQLSDLISIASTETLQEVRQTNSDHAFYAVGVYVTSDVSLMEFNASSRQSLERMTQVRRDYGGDTESQKAISALRWNMFDWGFDGIGFRHFKDANQMLGELLKSTSSEDGRLDHFAKSLAAMTRGLAGFISKEESHELATFCTVLDSSDASWVQIESARIINRPQLANEIEIAVGNFANSEQDNESLKSKFLSYCRQ